MTITTEMNTASQFADEVQTLIEGFLGKNPSQKEIISAFMLGCAGLVGATAVALNGQKHNSENEFFTDVDQVCDGLKRHIMPKKN